MKRQVTVVCALFGAWVGETAQAQLNPPVAAPVSTEPLTHALTAFAKQTGLQIIYLSEEVASARTQGAPAGLAPPDTLTRLLANTGLTFEYLNERTVRIFPITSPPSQGRSTLPAAANDASSSQVSETETAESKNLKQGADNSPGTNSVTRKRLFAQIAHLSVFFGATAHLDNTFAQSVAQEGESARLEEIVVTARKDVEPIESVPLSIQVFNPADLARAGQQGLEDMAQLTPGFVFQTYSSDFDSSPTIRGLSQFDVTSSVANVSTEINGVYVPRNYSVDLGIVDISRVEIAKGPQSALYGSNAFAGVIGYTLTAPPTKPEAQATLTTGNGGRIDTKFAAGDSWLDDLIAVRANYASSKYDGTWRNLFPANEYEETYHLGGHNNETYGATVRIKPVKSVEVDFDYFHLDRQENLKPAYNVSNSDRNNKFNCGPTLPGAFGPDFICGTLSYNPSSYQSSLSEHLPGLEQPFQPGFTSGTTFFSGRVKADLTPELELTYVYGWVGAYATEITSAADDPLHPAFGINYNSFFSTGCIVGAPTCNFNFGFWDTAYKEGGTNQLGSHEVRLAWDRGPLKVLIGGYLSEDTDNYAFGLGSFAAGSALTGSGTIPFDFSGFDFPLLGQVRTTKSAAAFGRVSYDFLDARANVALELRHTKDDLGSVASTTGTIVGAAAADILHRGTSYDETTPRLTASYKVTPTELIYLSGAEGVKQGGYNPVSDSGLAIPVGEQTFAPEKNWTYELGTKNTLFDGRAIINADVFLVRWSNLQIEEQPSNATLGVLEANITVNQGGATSKGFESDGQFAVTRNLALNYAFAYVDATFDKGDISGEILGLCDGITCPVNGAIGGNQLPRYSKVQGAAGATWKQAITADYSWSVHGEMTYQSQQQVDELNLTQVQSRTLFNANGSLRSDHWDLTIWGKNILNKKYVADAFYEPSGSSRAVGYGPSLGELATYGITLNIRLF